MRNRSFKNNIVVVVLDAELLSKFSQNWIVLIHVYILFISLWIKWALMLAN